MMIEIVVRGSFQSVACMNGSKLLYNGMNTLPNVGRLIIDSTMEGMCLDNNKRKETMSTA